MTWERSDLNEEANILNFMAQQDDRLISKWDNHPAHFAWKVAQACKESGRMSEKQRKVLAQPIPNTEDVDYDESDWELTNYEFCAGEWGD